MNRKRTINFGKGEKKYSIPNMRDKVNTKKMYFIDNILFESNSNSHFTVFNYNLPNVAFTTNSMHT